MKQALAPKGKEVYASVRGAVLSLGGVESVSLAGSLPLLFGFNQAPVQPPDGGMQLSISQTVVDADHFTTFGIRILSGRVFNSGDLENSQDVVVINRKMADLFWPKQNAVGRTILAGEPLRKAVVVGVVADGKYERLDEEPLPCFYYALSQHYQSAFDVVVRTRGDPRLWVARCPGHCTASPQP